MKNHWMGRAAALLLGACGGTADGGRAEPLCEGSAPACADTMIQQMQLVDTVAPGLVRSNAVDGAFIAQIDAIAGGFGASTPHAYVYARFTEAGLEKVEISDEASLSSPDWDIAFRRYVIRINSGDSGPSCVEAALAGRAFEAADAPAGAGAWSADDYFTEACELVDDGTGLSTSPGTALAGFYEYDGCLQMTGDVYVLRLADGRQVKLRVEAYYGDEQEVCASSGTPPSGAAGRMIVRWAFLE